MSSPIESIDLSAMTSEDLKTLAARVEAAKAAVVTRTKQEARSAIDAILAKAGLTLEEVYGLKKRAPAATPVAPSPAAPRKKRKPAKVIFHNPADPSQTWTGRGRAPRWYTPEVAEAQGGKPRKAPAVKAAGAKRKPSKKARRSRKRKP